MTDTSKGMTGSDVAAIMGANKAVGPLLVYSWKVDGATPVPSHEARKDALLPLAEQAYTEKYGYKSTKYSPARQIDWKISAPDRIVSTPLHIVKFEFPLSRNFGDWGPPGLITPRNGGGSIPMKTLIECVWDMIVTDVHTCNLVVMFDDEISVYTILWDEYFAGAVEEAARMFWHDHVLKGKAPEADWRPKTREYLQKKYPRPDDVMLPSSMVAIETCSIIRALRSLIKQQEQAEAEAVNKLIMFIGNHAGIDGLCKWPAVQGRVQWDIIARRLADKLDLSLKEWESLQEEFRGPGHRRLILVGESND